MPATVLVVEDDAGTRALIGDAREAHGYQVIHAVDGAALQVAHDLQPQVILLDLLMPQMNGREVRRRLRADPVTATMPIIALSASERLADLPAALVDDRLPSHALFGFDAYRASARKYHQWAAALFRSYDPPRLKETVHLYIAPWQVGNEGPLGRVASLAAVEKSVIALASIDHADELLNVDGT